MKNTKKDTNIENTRIPFLVESPRGDDKLGTGPRGEIITDHEAKEKNVQFQEGVPPEYLQKAAEGQLEKDKWVHLEKKDGSSELLTKKDMEKSKQFVFGENGNITAPTPPPPPAPPKAKELEKEKEPGKAPATAAKSECKAACKTPREEWESKFEDVRSAAATHKVKPG